MNFGKRIGLAVGAVALGMFVSASAVAQVTPRLVTAGGVATSTKIVPGGTASIDARLDVVTLNGANPGATGLVATSPVLTQSAPASNGWFSITGRSFVGSPFYDPTFAIPDATALNPPSNLLDPQNNDQLGESTPLFAPTPPALNTLAVNLTLTSAAATPLATYTISIPAARPRSCRSPRTTRAMTTAWPRPTRSSSARR